ncbi:MAG TPA: hypothetical protein H9881_12405 [Candidatus Stackebrandtia excrementipullorum]|nr:hypothetical protein [Candidatus Stackebrandtia excrementipullorum]
MAVMRAAVVAAAALGVALVPTTVTATPTDTTEPVSDHCVASAQPGVSTDVIGQRVHIGTHVTCGDLVVDFNVHAAAADCGQPQQDNAIDPRSGELRHTSTIPCRVVEAGALAVGSELTGSNGSSNTIGERRVGVAPATAGAPITVAAEIRVVPTGPDGGTARGGVAVYQEGEAVLEVVLADVSAFDGHVPDRE